MIGLIITICLFTRGLFYVGSKDYLLEGVRHWIAVKVFRLKQYYNMEDESYSYWKHHKEWHWLEEAWKPFWGCLYCMNSFWGILICLWAESSFIGGLLAIVAATGLSFTIDKLK